MTKKVVTNFPEELQTLTYAELGQILGVGERQAQRFARVHGLRVQLGPRKFVIPAERVRWLLQGSPS